jgi:hypothetical protein
MSIVQAWGRSNYIISDDKCYVSIMLQKVLRSKRKKYDEKKRKVMKKRKKKERKKERKKKEKEIK